MLKVSLSIKPELEFTINRNNKPQSTFVVTTKARAKRARKIVIDYLESLRVTEIEICLLFGRLRLRSCRRLYGELL